MAILNADNETWILTEYSWTNEQYLYIHKVVKGVYVLFDETFHFKKSWKKFPFILKWENIMITIIFYLQTNKTFQF